jgi:hypothetical protein
MEASGEARFVRPLLDHFKATPLSNIGQAEVEACAHKLYPSCKGSTVYRTVYTPISVARISGREVEEALVSLRDLR